MKTYPFKFLCKMFDHKWPELTHVLLLMASIENRNGRPTTTTIKCLRCGKLRDLNKEAEDIENNPRARCPKCGGGNFFQLDCIPPKRTCAECGHKWIGE